jgi:hypothetical protein
MGKIFVITALIFTFASPSWVMADLMLFQCCRIDNHFKIAKASPETLANTPLEAKSGKAHASHSSHNSHNSHSSHNNHNNHAAHMTHEAPLESQEQCPDPLITAENDEEEPATPLDNAGCGNYACGPGLSSLTTAPLNLSTLSLANILTGFPLPLDDSAQLPPFSSPPYHPPKASA